MTGKETLISIIKQQGKCRGLNCGDCHKVFTNFCDGNNRDDYRNAVNKFVELYGKAELVEILL